MKENRFMKITVRILCYLVLFVLVVICIIPFYNIFINATHQSADITTAYQLLPGKYLKENYETLRTYTNVWRAFGNSLFVAVSCTVLSAYVGALTAYGFAKYHFRFNKALFWILLATMMLPAQLSLIGYFQLMDTLKLLDKHLALILPSIANASAVFFIRQYMYTSVPDSLIESARIDGCAELKIFHRIVFPMIKPAVFTQAIFIFVNSWNNFINPLILIFSPEKLTLPVVIQQMKGSYAANYGVIYLGTSIAVLPIIIFAAFFLKHIVGGLTVGAVKE
ncbi:MAG: carbohydrate ABC transporter permease [Marvinbryantia sp.]